MTIKTLVVLAAGNGSRFGGPKQFHRFAPLNITLLEYNLLNAIRYGFTHLVIISRTSHEAYIAELTARLPAHIKVDIAIQDLSHVPIGCHIPADRTKPLGTAHALWCAKPYLTEPFAIINGDDYYGLSAFQLTRHFSTYKLLIVAFLAKNTLSENGGVNRGICHVNKGKLLAIKEAYDLRRKGKNIIGLDDNSRPLNITQEQLVSMNFWCFSTDVFPVLEQVLLDTFSNNNKDNAEALLPDAVTLLIRQYPDKSRVEASHDAWFGVTYSADCSYVEQALKKQF